MNEEKISKIKQSILQKEDASSKAEKSTKSGSTSSLPTESIERNLLGELYPDRLFLKECSNDPTLMDSEDVADLIRQGNAFFDQRLAYYKARSPFALKLNNI